MSQTDAEDRLDADELSDRLDGIRDTLRVARAVGEENAIRVEPQGLCCGGVSGDNRHVAPTVDQLPENIPLDAEIIGHDAELLIQIDNTPGRTVRPAPFAVIPRVRSVARDFTDQIAPDQARRSLNSGLQAL